jgi:hypothetical protein
VSTSLSAPRPHTLQDQTTALASDYTRADGTVFTGKHFREKKITDSCNVSTITCFYFLKKLYTKNIDRHTCHARLHDLGLVLWHRLEH